MIAYGGTFSSGFIDPPQADMKNAGREKSFAYLLMWKRQQIYRHSF
jgi:hypothetical protein